MGMRCKYCTPVSQVASVVGDRNPPLSLPSIMHPCGAVHVPPSGPRDMPRYRFSTQLRADRWYLALLQGAARFNSCCQLYLHGSQGSASPTQLSF